MRSPAIALLAVLAGLWVLSEPADARSTTTYLGGKVDATLRLPSGWKAKRVARTAWPLASAMWASDGVIDLRKGRLRSRAHMCTTLTETKDFSGRTLARTVARQMDRRARRLSSRVWRVRGDGVSVRSPLYVVAVEGGGCLLVGPRASSRPVRGGLRRLRPLRGLVRSLRAFYGRTDPRAVRSSAAGRQLAVTVDQRLDATDHLVGDGTVTEDDATETMRLEVSGPTLYLYVSISSPGRSLELLARDGRSWMKGDDCWLGGARDATAADNTPRKAAGLPSARSHWWVAYRDPATDGQGNRLLSWTGYFTSGTATIAPDGRLLAVTGTSRRTSNRHSRYREQVAYTYPASLQLREATPLCPG